MSAEFCHSVNYTENKKLLWILIKMTGMFNYNVFFFNNEIIVKLAVLILNFMFNLVLEVLKILHNEMTLKIAHTHMCTRQHTFIHALTRIHSSRLIGIHKMHGRVNPTNVIC